MYYVCMYVLDINMEQIGLMRLVACVSFYLEAAPQTIRWNAKRIEHVVDVADLSLVYADDNLICRYLNASGAHRTQTETFAL